jgi:AraC family transcriptional regulator
LLPRNSYEATYLPKGPIIGFAFDSQVGTHAFGSDRRTYFRAKPNGLAYVPAGCDVYSMSQRGGEYLKITLAPEQSESFSRDRRFSDVIDHLAIGAAQRLRCLLIRGDHSDRLQCERIVDVLKERAISVLRETVVTSPAASCMTPRRLRMIDELIEARLDGSLTVKELADALGLSAGFFSRAFKAAIGKAPHDYIVDRRIARARILLFGTQRDLAAIACASGFSSHAHMTATFRDRLGINPSVLRQQPRVPESRPSRGVSTTEG